MPVIEQSRGEVNGYQKTERREQREGECRTASQEEDVHDNYIHETGSIVCCAKRPEGCIHKRGDPKPVLLVTVFLLIPQSEFYPFFAVIAQRQYSSSTRIHRCGSCQLRQTLEGSGRKGWKSELLPICIPRNTRPSGVHLFPLRLKR